MATVVEFTTPAAEFPLGTVFETAPDVTIELERIVPHGTHLVPYFWMRDGSPEDVEAAFESHPGLTDVRLVDSVDAEHLLRAEWDREHVGVLSGLTEAGLVVLSGVGTSEGWVFEVRGDSREDVGEFRTYCQHNDVPIQITTVHALLPVQGESYELTERQREALLAAFEQGYFDSPRSTSLSDVADGLGITQQSLSSRLRRGHRQLISATLASE